MPRPTLDQLRGVTDFAVMFRWNLALTFPTGFAGVTSEEVNLRCESAALPTASFEDFTISIRGQKTKAPGIMNYGGTLDTQLVETIDNKIHLLITNWRELIWATNTGVAAGNVNSLKGTAILSRLDNQDNQIWHYNVIGLWPSTYTLPTLDGSTSDAIKPSITWSYDYFKDGAN